MTELLIFLANLFTIVLACVAGALVALVIAIVRTMMGRRK